MAVPEETAAGAGRRVLLVSDERGWPRTSGYRRRTSMIVRALAEVGRVHWVVAPRDLSAGSPEHALTESETEAVVPDDLTGRVSAQLVAPRARSKAETARHWLQGERPWPSCAADWSPVVERLRAHAGAEPWDVVWAMGIDPLAAVDAAGVSGRSVFIDADLESRKLARRVQHGRLDPLRRMIARRDVARWRRQEAAALARVTGFSVCSELERAELGPPAFVTVNAYPRPEPAGSARGGSSPTLLFIGSLTYEPNVDGLRHFLDAVWPSVRRAHPDAELRVVGRGAPDDIAGPGVVRLGGIADTGPELTRATAVVVPIRWGAGTRVKILEAFANRVPVVSTPLGAEGLDVAHGRELLLADDPAGFAAHCSALLADRALGRRLADAAFATFARDHDEAVVAAHLATRVAAALEVAAPGSDAGDSSITGPASAPGSESGSESD